MTTLKQQAVLGFVQGYIASKGASPTLKEIGSALGMAESTVHIHVRKLIEDGQLLRKGRHHRGLKLPRPSVCPSCGATLPSTR